MFASFLEQAVLSCVLCSCLQHFAKAETCYDDYSCALSTLSGQPYCYGYHSCTEADINIQNVILCYGSYSCYKATRIRQPSSTHYNIQCYGLFSCAEVPNIYIQDGTLNCHGELSCYNSTITILEDHLNCYGNHACKSATIYSRNNNYIHGHAAAKDAIFYSQDTSVLYHFYGRASGDGATIYCGSGATCYIYCYQDACNNLELSCYNGEGTCTFSVDCTYAEESDNCPDGYVSQQVFSVPDISDYVASTYDNSVLSCSTPLTQAEHCDDFEGCRDYILSNVENKAPICCTASSSCYNAYNMSTAVNTNESFVNNVAVRCDGYYSCYSIDNGIFSNANGNIYFSGLYSGYQVASVVGQYGITDIFCTGYLSCHYCYNMRNGNNVHCTGAYGCQYAVISQMQGSIYAYGSYSAQYAVISGIGGAVYCGSYQSCYQSRISGTSALFSSGPDALSGSTIISELNGGTLTVTIEGTNSETFEIYCNTTDVCKIACKTADACEKVELRCDKSECYVDCDESNGIECPFYGFYQYYNSSEGITLDMGDTTIAPEATQGADSNYECDLENDGVVLSWDAFFEDPSFIYDKTDISFTQGVDDATNTIEVTVSASAKYLVAATYDEYSDYYEGVTENDMLGLTYVLDVNSFDTSNRLLEDAHVCENRKSSSFSGKDFLNDYWDYTLYPGNSSQLGNDKYLEYGDQNIWDIELVGYGCDTVRWTHTFAFDELFGTCSDGEDSSTYTLTETTDDVTFATFFYLTLVSPDPLFLTGCDNGNTDCGRYITATLLSHQLSISFPKQQQTISDNNNVLVDLFTSNIVGATFIEGDISEFELVLRTTVPVAIVLNVSTATILSPTESDLINNNGGNDFIDSISIIENFDEYISSSGDCLIATNHRCWQEFSIIIQVNNCPSDTGLTFDGDYYFSAEFTCRDTSGDGIVNQTEQDICNEYLNVQEGNTNPYLITFESINLQYTELCDATAYSVDWSGSVIFYDSDEFDNEDNEFTGGNTVYTKVSINDDVSNYDLFGMSIQECYVCVANINDSANLGDVSANGCLDTNYVDTDQVYNLDEDGLDFVLLNSNINDTFEDFSFTLPVFASSSVNVFYVDCIVELGLTTSGQGGVRRRTRRFLSAGFNGNTFENVVGYGFYDNNVKDNKNPDVINPEFRYIVIICVILMMLVLVILIAIWCVRKAKKGPKITQEGAADIIISGKLPVRAASTP